MIAKININYEIDKFGKYIFSSFNDYEKFIYLPFYYAFHNVAFYRSRTIIHSDNDIEKITERYLDNTLYVDSFRPSCILSDLVKVRHVWYISDRFRSNLYLREKSRSDFFNHSLSYYHLFSMLENIFGKEVLNV